MAYRFSQRSEKALENIHPDLNQVIRRSLKLSPLDFMIIEGLRSPTRQQELFKNGASRTLNSRHLTGHATDLAPLINKAIPWQDWSAFTVVAQAMKQSALELEIPIIWGGDWKMRDGPHFELPKGRYP